MYLLRGDARIELYNLISIMAKYRISEEKLAQLEADLEAAVEARKDIVEKVHVARELGDLKENSEYHAARDEQRLNELKIEDIEEILRDYEIADKGGTNSTIDIGNNVKLKGPKALEFKLVDSVEANPTEGKISDESPIGQSLMGKKVGDEVEVGGKKYKIEEIS